ncbi:rhomboid-related protein 2 isoform X2 [Tribolium castaneum]|uniref:Rhomboid-4 n=1 Tax=Tribolium castaneum TaxID=7070 RepID=D2A5C5_TRICA|nr:PREDICTED: rhomboid-related protein 2 isoform X2 [Tribolium castaneum]EFA05728.1 rhomboid-4 [Tribolium castaneum]|eukprot:XP_015836344.1 PREDICTED: rhomboid-related protein 2 isoform X2 [Tribolium castaneum]
MASNRSLHLDLELRTRDESQIPLNHTPTSPTDQYYRSIFDRADTNKDGVVTPNELERVVDRLSLTDEPPPQQLIRQIHQMADKNQDGGLDYGEFVTMIKTQPLFKKVVTRYVNFILPRKKQGAVATQVDGAGEYEDQYKFCPPKIGMITISIIELIFFAIDEYRERNSTLFAAGPMAQLFIYDPERRYEAWRYLTYMFVHIGYLHLVVNLVVQVFLGIPLEMVHDWWRVLLVYVTGVVAGSLGTSITDPRAKLAGASGGVYSLITAHIATIIMNWHEMSMPFVQLAIFLLITGVDVGTSIYNRYWANLDEPIGYMAHFSGALAGLLVGICVLKNLQITKKENIIWWVSIAVYLALMVGAVVWNIFYSDYFPTQK